VSFLDDVRRAIERPERARAVLFGASVHRKVLLDALETLEARGAAEEKIERLHDVWSDKLDPFVEEMRRKLAEGLAFGEPAEVVTSLVDTALRRRLGLFDSAGSKTRDRELDRISSDVLFSIDAPPRRPRLCPERYALEVRALRKQTGSIVVTPIGKLVLDLPERDAVRWLLAAEVALSRGPLDPFRLSRAAATRIATSKRLRVFWYGGDAAPVHLATLDRLAAFGLLSFEDEGEDGLTTYELTADGASLIEEVSSVDTPMILLANALMKDEAAAVLAEIQGASRLLQRESAASAMTRHARMVAHEVRNALVPVREAIDDLFDDLRKGDRAPLVERHGPVIVGGVDRIFRFMTEMVTVASRASPPPEPFDVSSAIEDALSIIAADVARAPKFVSPDHRLPPLEGRRDRFVLCIVNLLRNASQARGDRPTEIRVSASLSHEGDSIVVTVDDDGRGVPPELRRAVFEEGFSLKPSGTGQGLALVREVVEAELAGEVACVDSPLGGARFLLRMPLSGVSKARKSA